MEKKEEKTLQIETGVFWVCSKGGNADLIYDKGTFTKCGNKRTAEKITKDEDGLNYKLSHKKAWEELSKTAADGIPNFRSPISRAGGSGLISKNAATM